MPPLQGLSVQEVSNYYNNFILSGLQTVVLIEQLP
jgi:hypothetical protein